MAIKVPKDIPYKQVDCDVRRAIRAAKRPLSSPLRARAEHLPEVGAGILPVKRREPICRETLGSSGGERRTRSRRRPASASHPETYPAMTPFATPIL